MRRPKYCPVCERKWTTSWGFPAAVKLGENMWQCELDGCEQVVDLNPPQVVGVEAEG